MFVVFIVLMMILIVAFLKYFKIFRKKINKYFEIYCLLFLFDWSFNIVIEENGDPGGQVQEA